jgi:hypothetical protein
MGTDKGRCLVHMAGFEAEDVLGVGSDQQAGWILR